MKKKLLVLALMGWLLVACNSAGSEEAAADLPTVVPTIVIAESVNESSAPDDAPAVEEAPVGEVVESESGEAETAVTTESESNQVTDSDVVDLDEIILYEEPQGMDYRTTLQFTMSVDGAVVGAATAQGSRTVSPNASNMVFTLSGDAASGLGETMTMTQIEDAFYTILPPQNCITLAGQSGFENPFDLFLDTGGFLTDDAQRMLPDETINGVDSAHYVLNAQNFASWDVAEIYEADLYVAKEGGYVTRLMISGRGVNNLLNSDASQEGDIFYELNFIPEAVPAIAVPQGCADAAELTSEYPMLADATAVQSAPGLFSYETQTSFDEVIAFYKEALTANGEWAIAQEIVQAPNATITFTGADGTLMVNLGPGQNGGVIVGILSMP
ncbi:MAG: hypothetical protein H6652_22785 [Ardenticatenaceae bacterium]|nr:hypothetical protein [Ardenticatenaceae bacterium]MCB8950145.1 hypothetical protein [Ardenticatenaceae bacterium]